MYDYYFAQFSRNLLSQFQNQPTLLHNPSPKPCAGFQDVSLFARSGSELFSSEVDPILVGSRPHVEQFFDIQEPYAINQNWI